jgi:archaemetzincin
VEQHPPDFDPELAFDPARGQYNSRILMRLLATRHAERCDYVLGVTRVDLFMPVLTFVFGEAQLGGPTAVVSTMRLHPEMYGLPPNPGRVGERLRKEALHEIGHCLGLLHCDRPSCVMWACTYVEQIDLKGSQFCGACQRSLATEVGAVRSSSPR